MSELYSKRFFASYADVSYRSASFILPLINELITPKQVVDIGCGVGTWLRAWEELGVSALLGVDGDYVDRDALLISKDKFMSMNLSSPQILPESRFALAQSLEVAEHLPPSSAPAFVHFLCSLAPVVLFSAAIPYQGGVNHINEQWPEYWADLFLTHGYLVFDVIRPNVWHNQEVQYYYAQNTFLYVDQDKLSDYPALTAPADHRNLARVHPRKWEEQLHRTPKLEHLLAAIPQSTFDFGKRAVRKARHSFH